MSNERRAFLKVGSVLAGTALLSNPLDVLANVSKKVNTLAENQSLRVYQTNDLLGRLKTNYDNIGGLPAVKSLIRLIVGHNKIIIVNVEIVCQNNQQKESYFVLLTVIKKNRDYNNRGSQL